MAKAIVGVLLGISIALMQFALLFPLWGLIFTYNNVSTFLSFGVFGAILLILLLISMISYPNMPLKKAILGTLIGAGICLGTTTVYYALAYFNGWLCSCNVSQFSCYINHEKIFRFCFVVVHINGMYDGEAL